MNDILPSFSDLLNWRFILFLFVFVLSICLIIGAETGVIPGWEFLTKNYPDRKEQQTFKLENQSGMMGLWFNLYNSLTIDICPSGLRFEVTKIFGMKMFGTLYHKFFVPWEEITLTREKIFCYDVAKLHLGEPPVGKLILSVAAADRLEQASGSKLARK